MTRWRVPFVDLSAQHRALAEDLQTALRVVVERSIFIQGDELHEFEQQFAAYLNVPWALGVGSGLDALRLALVALGIRSGDEVILPANTFIATALAVSATGARPVLVDVDEVNLGIDVGRLLKVITPRTKAIIPVHLYGRACELTQILEVAARKNLWVVEDACQAHGARWNGRSCGTVGDAGCFSFYPSKNLGGAGDGGMVVTSRRDVAERVRALRDYGQVGKAHHVMKGLNSRLDEIQAAILRTKLPHLDDWNRRRAAHAARYAELLKGCDGLRATLHSPFPEDVFHLYVVRVRERDALKDHLARRGIETGIHYPVPIHLQPAYADLGYRQGDFEVTERFARDALSLPMYPELSRRRTELVADAVREFYQPPRRPDRSQPRVRANRRAIRRSLRGGSASA